MAVRGMHRHIAVAAVLVALLAGCNEGAEGPTPTDPPPTDSTTVNSDDSAGDARGGDGADGADGSDGQSEPPEVEVPARPAEMDEETVAGAIAAAKYFMELYPYIYATGDLQEWDALSDEGCGFCTNVSGQVSELYENAGRAEGIDTEIYSDYGGGPYSDGVYIVDLGVRFSASVFVDGDDVRTEYEPEDRPDFSVSLAWRENTWLVLGIDAGEKK